jgi:NAD(P)-dependent dehydrogenase (short-subunit alcohol dehydrogenase family)
MAWDLRDKTVLVTGATSGIGLEASVALALQLAASPELEGVAGKYFEQEKAVAPAPLAQDEALAKRLWSVSADLAGL